MPSVALAIQHHSTLSTNLPYNVGMAYGGQIQCEESRLRLSKCDVLVLTHGVCKDLLSHYGDLFSVGYWKLLILDECHNCIGNSPYAIIMDQFYHKTSPADRPRVLGLTASPLINVKNGHSDEQLEDCLNRLESCTDAKIYSLESVHCPAGDDYRRRFLDKKPDEKLIHYVTTPPPLKSWPKMEQFEMHRGRRIEFQQFFELFNNVGPYVMSSYLKLLVQDLTSPNTYEGETWYLLVNARHYLRLLIAFCEQCSFAVSHKVLQLQQLLHQQLIDGSAVGVVFVERRITALALNLHFNMSAQGLENQNIVPGVLDSSKEDKSETSNFTDQFSEGIESSNSDEDLVGDTRLARVCSMTPEVPHRTLLPVQHGRKLLSPSNTIEIPSAPDFSRIKSGVLVRNPKQIFKSLSFTGNETEKKCWIHQQCDTRKVINRLRSGEINVLIATAVAEEGIDVRACSFVVVFDAIATLKSYVQVGNTAMHGEEAWLD